MKNLIQTVRRPLYGVAALALLLGVTATSVLPGLVKAYATPDSRKIEMSSSVASDTAVTYKLTFTPNTLTQELVIDFCGDTPLIGATCAFAATSVPDVAGAAVSAVSAGATGTLTKPGSGTPKHTLVVTGLTMAAGTPYSITFTGINNPTATQSFYARVLTYGTGNSSQYVQANTTGGATTIGAGVVDAGGVALTTVRQINVTARVMESISFCVYGDIDSLIGTAGSGTCNATSVPDIELGTGTPPAIDSLSVYTNFVNFNLSSNATHGVVVRLKGDTLKSGANTIPAAGTTSTITAGTAKFGLHLPAATTTGPGTPVGTVNATTDYTDATGKYGLNLTNTQDTFGDAICNTNSAPLNGIKVPLTYGVTASITTPAGVYTTTHQLIASGTF